MSERVPLAQKAYILFYQRKTAPQPEGLKTKSTVGSSQASGLPNGHAANSTKTSDSKLPVNEPRVLDNKKSSMRPFVIQKSDSKADLPFQDRMSFLSEAGKKRPREEEKEVRPGPAKARKPTINGRIALPAKVRNLSFILSLTCSPLFLSLSLVLKVYHLSLMAKDERWKPLCRLNGVDYYQWLKAESSVIARLMLQLWFSWPLMPMCFICHRTKMYLAQKS